MNFKRSLLIGFVLAAAAFAYSQTVENVILMIPDGCSGNLIELYQMVSKLDTNKYPALAFEEIQTGMICTLNCDGRITDSAAAGTAYATGVKTKNAYVAMSPDGTALPTVAEKAKKKGLGVGLLTSDSINGATPSTFCAHVNNRGKVEDIKKMREAQGFDVTEGSEKKNRLAEKTTEALQLLSQNKKGFFMMVEGGTIDHLQHANNPVGALEELKDFNRAVTVVRAFVKSNDKTLLIIAPDHDTGGMTITNTNLVSNLLKKTISEQDLKQKRINIDVFGVSYKTGGHTEIDVPLWSEGPQAMSGKIDNTDVNKHIVKVLDL